MPPQRHEALGRNVDVRVRLDRVQDLDDAGVSERPELLEGIARQREARLVRGDVKGEDAAVGPVFLEGALETEKRRDTREVADREE